MKPKKLTKKQQAALDLTRDSERDAKFKAFEAFKSKFTGLVFKAEVVWFDKSSGEGMARGLNGEGNWPLYACSIKGKKTWFAETACVYHSAGQVIDAEIHVFYGGSILGSHSQGTFDAEKWARLDQNKLAFKCNDDGQAINGLLAKGASL